MNIEAVEKAIYKLKTKPLKSIATFVVALGALVCVTFVVAWSQQKGQQVATSQLQTVTNPTPPSTPDTKPVTDPTPTSTGVAKSVDPPPKKTEIEITPPPPRSEFHTFNEKADTSRGQNFTLVPPGWATRGRLVVGPQRNQGLVVVTLMQDDRRPDTQHYKDLKHGDFIPATFFSDVKHKNLYWQIAGVRPQGSLVLQIEGME